MESGDDVINLLSYYSKYEMPGEAEFIEEQKKIGIQVCDTVYQDENNGNEELKIVTQLSVLKDFFELEDCPKTHKSKGLRRGHSNPINSDFYIKQVKLSQDINADSENKDRTMNITTIVSHKKREFEAVYSAKLTQSAGKPKLVKHESYIRTSNKPKLSSLHSSTDSIFIRETKPEVVNKSNTKKKRSFFTNSKKSKKDVQHKTEDGMGKQAKDEKSARGLFSIKGNMPFTPFKIDELCQRNTRSNSVWDTMGSSKKTTAENSKKTIGTVKEYSTNTQEMGKIAATNVVLTLDTENDELKYEAGTKNTLENVCESMEPLESIHVDMDIPKQNIRRMSCPTMTCNCHETRMSLISQILLQINEDEVDEGLKKKLELLKPDILHFIYCPLDIPVQPLEKIDNWRKSQHSLYKHCDICVNPDDQLNDDCSPSLSSFDDLLKDGKKPHFTDSYLDIFRKIDCYEHFDIYFKKSVGSTCTPLNVARLHDATRRIVRHIGNPNDKENKQIRKLFRFSETFYFYYFYNHIQEYHGGSLEKFLVECCCDNFEDID